jgi:signal transduction histidine kinase
VRCAPREPMSSEPNEEPASEFDPGTRAIRQLARLRFDLHDGPQQDVILLAEDLRLLQSQLELALGGHPLRDRLVGHLGDLQSRLVSLDSDLRRIASQLESPFLADRPFKSALAELIEAFRERTGLNPRTEVSGEFDSITDSQQITLLALIREALNNIREHSGASAVAVNLVLDVAGVEASVQDDGCGFDPETALVKAAREGHLGLVGMHERVQMLGGNTLINSRPGGPTIISVRLPAQKARPATP